MSTPGLARTREPPIGIIKRTTSPMPSIKEVTHWDITTITELVSKGWNVYTLPHKPYERAESRPTTPVGAVLGESNLISPMASKFVANYRAGKSGVHILRNTSQYLIFMASNQLARNVDEHSLDDQEATYELVESSILCVSDYLIILVRSLDSHQLVWLERLLTRYKNKIFLITMFRGRDQKEQKDSLERFANFKCYLKNDIQILEPKDYSDLWQPNAVLSKIMSTSREKAFDPVETLYEQLNQDTQKYFSHSGATELILNKVEAHFNIKLGKGSIEIVDIQDTLRLRYAQTTTTPPATHYNIGEEQFFIFDLAGDIADLQAIVNLRRWAMGRI